MKGGKELQKLNITAGIVDHHRSNGLYSCRGFEIDGDYLRATPSGISTMVNGKTYIGSASDGAVRQVGADGTTITTYNSGGTSIATLADTATLAPGGAYKEFKDKFYFVVDNGTNTKWYKHDPDGTSIADALHTLGTTGEYCAMSVHHKQDDSLYGFSGNKVYRHNGTSFEGLVLTLPSDETIEHSFEFDRYLVVVTRTKKKDKTCYAYVWDRDSSLSGVTFKIDLGRGRVWAANRIGNIMKIVVSDDSANTLRILTCSERSILREKKMRFKDLNDPGDDEGSVQALHNGKIYFQGSIERGIADTGDDVETAFQTGFFSVDISDHLALEVDSKQISSDGDVDPTFEAYSVHFSGSTLFTSYSDSSARARKLTLNSSSSATYVDASRIETSPIGHKSGIERKLAGVLVEVVPTHTSYGVNAELTLTTRTSEWESWAATKVTRNASSTQALSGSEPIIYTFVKDDNGDAFIQGVAPQIAISVKEGVSIQDVRLLWEKIPNNTFDI